MLRVSVITPCLNSAHYLEETIRSVLNQTYPHIEYFVIDGGSQDGTLEILHRYSDHLTWVSESDQGQAAAINTGLQRANGDIVAWLNADDLYLPQTIETVVQWFEQNEQANFLYGDAIAIDAAGRSYGRRSHVRPCNANDLIHRSDFIVQPAAFWRAHVGQHMGPLDTRFHYAFDYEYWMRLACQMHLHYVRVPLAKERLHAAAKTPNGGLARIRELKAIARQYGGQDVPYLFQAEAAAQYVRAGWRAESAWRRDILWTQAWHYAHFPLKTLAYCAAWALWGEVGTLRLRLWSNWLRHLMSYTSISHYDPLSPLPKPSAPVGDKSFNGYL